MNSLSYARWYFLPVLWMRLPEEEAWKAITINPAVITGIADRVGSLEVGKDADVVLCDGDPMVSDTHVLTVFVNGRQVVG